MTGILGPYPGSCFSLWPVFVQHDAAQLYLTVWNLIKNQITDVDLVSPRTESSEREDAVLVHMETKRKRVECSPQLCSVAAVTSLHLSEQGQGQPLFLELCVVPPALDVADLFTRALFAPLPPTPRPTLQVARLQALYTIRLKESFVCLECTSEMSRDSSMLALPLSVFDMHWKPLKTLVRFLLGSLLFPAAQCCQCSLASLMHPWLLKTNFHFLSMGLLSSPLICRKNKSLLLLPLSFLLLNK